MREIKFKAKRIDNGEWVCGCYVNSGFYTNSKSKQMHFIIEDSSECFDDVIEVTPETVCQYTELKDKNGVEIYEGDFITCRWETPDGFRFHKGFVRYDSLNVKFYSHSLKQEISRSLSGINKDIEVTGNKHD